MSENHYQPTPDDPGSHHFVEATANEIGRLGTQADEAFLAKVTEQLQQSETIDSSKDPLTRKSTQTRTRRKVRNVGIYSFAALVILSLVALFVAKNTASEDIEVIKTSPEPPEPITPSPNNIEVIGHKSTNEKINPIYPNQHAQDYIVRMQTLVSNADDTALRGADFLAEGDFESAVEQFRNAIDLLPEAPKTKDRKEIYIKQYSRAAIKLAREYADAGKYNYAITLIEDVLSPTFSPDYAPATQLLEQLNDADYFTNVELTSAHLDRVRKVKQALETSKGYRDYGDYDRAEREYHKALNIDRYNSAARRSLEDVERLRLNYSQVARDQTRSAFLSQVSEGWETQAPDTLGSEKYTNRPANAFQSPLTNPLSTFSIDVDTAAYSNIRRLITLGQAVPKAAVRIEEMINYFSYTYPQPKGKHPFAFATEIANCPWQPEHQLLRVGIQTREIPKIERLDANLVFLIDVSGSMQDPEKLPLVKQSLELLIEELTAKDKLSIVVYAGAEGLCLPPTSGDQKHAISQALKKLTAGGMTNGGAGIKLAYQLATQNFIKDGVNRVILCTDGDFNVGNTGDTELVELVKSEAKNGAFLTVLGFGEGNLNDSMLEAITNHGNGTYSYIDNLKEGRKVLLQDMMSTLVTVARDVKIQVEFNPKFVQNYRLIGYANRGLKSKDFKNDKVDAGEVGFGHSVTALYQIVPPGVDSPIEPGLKYQKTTSDSKIIDSAELCTIKLRYKPLDDDNSILMQQPVVNGANKNWQQASSDYQWAAAVANWGMLMSDPSLKGESTELLKKLASNGAKNDVFGRRKEMLELIDKHSKLK